MEQEQLIPAEIICTHHKIETSFIFTLESAGLIETSRQNDAVYIHPSQLPDLEKFIFFHYGLDINLEGIEAIAGLLQRISLLQEEMAELRRKLRAMR
jgi:hypothetical protein